MSKKFSILFLSFCVLAFFLTGVVFAEKISKSIEVRFADIQLIVNDKPINTSAEPFIYEGNVYAPVATVANMLGIKQLWNNEIPAVLFSDDLKGEEITQYQRAMGLHRLDFLTSLKFGSGDLYPNSHHYYVIFKNYAQDQQSVVPQIEKDGFTTISEPISSFVRVSTKNKNQFLLLENLISDENPDLNETYLSLFEYDKVTGELTKIYSQLIGTGNYAFSPIFHEETKELIIRVYNNNFELKGVKFYKWESEQFILKNELITP